MRLIVFIIVILGFAFSASAQETGPDITQVVEAQTAWQAKKNSKTRKALKAALAAYDDDPTLETVRVHYDLLNHDIEHATPHKLRETAQAVVEHLEPVAEILPQQYVEAKFIGAIALFNGRQKREAVLEMAEVEGRAYAAVDEEGERLGWAEDLHWKAYAWRLAMRAYFKSTGEWQPTEKQVDEILAKWKATSEQVNARAHVGETKDGALPHCAGELIQEPRMRYPAGKAMRGMFGSVILRFGFDEAGNIKEPEVMASIPLEGFKDRASETVSQWRFEATEPNEVGKTCRLHRENVVLPMVFAIG
ncbi:TonB family protein [Hyphomonas sp. FCG-A18]|uniref:TonB family protein n=1 Tax=Hyphomonas sp. FCG-A18 TaxID=3080019 RepID=UPI002B2ADA7C|nr:TonB family protein [Hyphomonas sp. FCG-A18]